MDILSIVSPEAIYAFVGGTLLTTLVQCVLWILKKYNLKPTAGQTRGLVLAVALVLGVAYTGFQSFVPEVLQAKIVDFTWYALGASVFIYEFIWKNFPKEDSK